MQLAKAELYGEKYFESIVALLRPRNMIIPRDMTDEAMRLSLARRDLLLRMKLIARSLDIRLCEVQRSWGIARRLKHEGFCDNGIGPN